MEDAEDPSHGRSLDFRLNESRGGTWDRDGIHSHPQVAFWFFCGAGMEPPASYLASEAPPELRPHP